MGDPEIKALVARLSRPHPSGGVVIERAAIMASGADSGAVMDWILAHSGTPDTTVQTARNHGLHGPRPSDATSASQKPTRFVLPAGTLR
jgi:hypothetical protein